jgi:hypothetical protein
LAHAHGVDVPGIRLQHCMFEENGEWGAPTHSGAESPQRVALSNVPLSG